MKKLIKNNSMKPYIKNVSTFRFLSEKELDELITSSEILQYGDEEVIIKQGDFDQSFFAVLKGSVKVTVDNEDSCAYICTLGEAEVFGEAGIFVNVERTANVISMDEAVILKIEREPMMKFIKNNPKAGNKIFMVTIYSMLQKLKEANRELAYERRLDSNQADIDDLINSLVS